MFSHHFNSRRFGMFALSGGVSLAVMLTTALALSATPALADSIAGTVSAASDADLGAGNVTFNGGTLENTASFTSSRSATLNLTGGTFLTDQGTSLTWAGPISGPGSLTKDGSGMLVLTGPNSYTGGTTINAGTLSVSTIAALGNNAGAVTFEGGTLQATTTMTNAHSIVLDGDGTIEVTSGVFTENAAISGSGGLIVTGAGQVKMSVNNTYLGGTTIEGGARISILRDEGLGEAHGDLTIGNGTLSVNGNSSTIRHVTLDGDATILLSHSTFEMKGAIDGNGSLTRSGPGTTLIISGDATYAGVTTISQGTLIVGNGSTDDGKSGSIKGDIVNNATLVFDRSDYLASAGDISGTGTLEQRGTGILALSGTNTYSGVTKVTHGTLLIDGDQSGATGLLTASAGTTLGGHGTVGGDANAAGATLSPGDNGVS